MRTNINISIQSKTTFNQITNNTQFAKTIRAHNEMKNSFIRKLNKIMHNKKLKGTNN